RETADRVRMAILNSALDWPSTRRITILLSPADLPKSGAYFDLPMALAVLAAAGQIEAGALEDTVFAGELGLDGALRRTAGSDAITRAAAAAGFGRVVVPEVGATDLSDSPGLQVIALPSLAEVVAMLREENSLDQPPIATIRGS
ncbi:MAG: magnesium chelatase domain-containing protein, partial [Pseudonocardiaceae bacterium]